MQASPRNGITLHFINIEILTVINMAFKNKTDKNVTCENGVWTRFIMPPGDTGKMFGRTIFESMKEAAERVGQIDGLTDEEDAYASILDRAVRCAIWLRKHNVESGDFIGICSHYHLNTVIPIIAAIYNGITFHPWWNMALDDDMIKYFLTLGEPKVMFVNRETAEPIRKAIDDLDMETKVIVFENSPDEMSFLDILKEPEVEEVTYFECTRIENPKQPAVMLNTSGTTGNPKGVLHSYDWLANSLWFVPDSYVAGSRMLWSSGMCWITAVVSTMSLLRNSATAVIYPGIDARKACQLIQKYKINNFTTTVLLANQFYKYREDLDYDVSSIQYVYYTGANVSEEVDQHLIKKFHNGEVIFGYVRYYRLYSELGTTMGIDRTVDKVGSCGKIRENCRIKISNVEDGKTLGVNEEGEVCMKSPYLLLGYHKDPKNTAESIDADGWFHTGDFGYYDADGDFSIVDRIKNVIKYKVVEPVVPSRIEHLILKHPDVINVAVVPKPDLVDVEKPMAFITTRTGSKLTEEDIIKLVEDNLPDQMRLRGGVKILGNMPVTPSGKIARRILRQMAKDLEKL